MEVKGPYMHANRRLILIQKWCNTRDFQLTATLALPYAARMFYLLYFLRVNLERS